MAETAETLSNAVIQAYAALVRVGRKRLEDIPEKYGEAVRVAVEGGGELGEV